MDSTRKNNSPARLWQKAMIRLALSPAVKKIVQNLGPARQLAARFTAGEDPAAAVREAGTLAGRGVTASFFFLGEYVTDPATVSTTLKELGSTVVLARKAGLDLHTSIDPTQAGLMQSREICGKNLEKLARQIQMLGRAGRADVLMMDMEDARVTRDTLALFFSLKEKGLPVAVTLQACLKRTPEDLARAAASGTMIRLVKGAFAESPAIAHSPGEKTDGAFLHLVRTLLSPDVLEKGTCPVFATHDHRMIQSILSLAGTRGIRPDAYEFEMLYGVRPDLQRRLAAMGHRVRVYLPFGRDFWPYSVRRIGENPKNIRFLLRSL